MGLALVLFALSLGTALAASGKGGAGGGGTDLQRPSAGHDAVPGLAVAADSGQTEPLSALPPQPAPQPHPPRLHAQPAPLPA